MTTAAQGHTHTLSYGVTSGPGAASAAENSQRATELWAEEACK